MGVYKALREIHRRLMSEGYGTWVTRWRFTTSGAVTYDVVAYRGQVLPYEEVPSKSGTHPWAVFAIPREAKWLGRAVYERGSRGGYNYVEVQVCRAKEVESDPERVYSDSGSHSLTCVTVVAKDFEPDERLSCEYVEELAKAVSKIAEELGQLIERNDIEGARRLAIEKSPVLRELVYGDEAPEPA